MGMSYGGFATLAPWRDPEVTAIRRLPIRGWTAPDPAASITLDGSWNFHLYDGPSALPPETVEAGLDVRDWRTIEVPGEWALQDTGDLPLYTNVQMPFAGLPSEPPAHNPTGVYRTFVLSNYMKTLPTVLVFALLQKQFVSGLTLGANKG